MFNGEVPEWSKGNAWKAFVRVKLYRRFESCPLRHNSYIPTSTVNYHQKPLRGFSYFPLKSRLS